MDHSWMRYLYPYIFGLAVPFLIPYHLDGDKFVVFVVQTLQDLPEGAFPDNFEHFEPVGDVVVQHLEANRAVGTSQYE